MKPVKRRKLAQAGGGHGGELAMHKVLCLSNNIRCVYPVQWTPFKLPNSTSNQPSANQNTPALARARICGTSAYAISAFQVKRALAESITKVINFSVRAARDIASLDESDWAWFGALRIEQDWGKAQRQAAIKAVKEINTILEQFRCVTYSV